MRRRSATSVVTPNPGSTPFLLVSGLASKSYCTAPVATMSRPRSPGSPTPPASPTEMSASGRYASHTNCAAIAAATLPTPATTSTTGSDSRAPSQIGRLGLVASDRGRLLARVAASMSSAASTAIGRLRFTSPPPLPYLPIAWGGTGVTIVVAHPALRIGGVFVPALRHEVEPLVCRVEHVDSARVRRVRLEDRAGLVLVEHAGALS